MTDSNDSTLYTFAPTTVNTEALHERLQTAFGARYEAMGSSDEGVWFRLKGEARAGDEAALKLELDEHDPKALTRRQAMVAERPQAFQRLMEMDTEAMKTKMRGKKAEEVADALLDIIADLQKLLFTG